MDGRGLGNLKASVQSAEHAVADSTDWLVVAGTFSLRRTVYFNEHGAARGESDGLVEAVVANVSDQSSHEAGKK